MQRVLILFLSTFFFLGGGGGGGAFWKCSNSVFHYSILFLDYCVLYFYLIFFTTNEINMELA